MSLTLPATNAEIVLPAPSGSELEADSLRALTERVRGRRYGVVGDLPLWGPELLIAGTALGLKALAGAGAVSEQGLAVGAGLAAVLALGQVLGAGLLNAAFPRSPTWAVVVGTVDRSTTGVVAIPTDNPVPLLTVGRALLALALPLVPVLPWPEAAMSVVLPATLAFVRRRVPEVSACYRLAADAHTGLPIVLCGGSRREGRGLLGTLDWLHAERPVVHWVVGVTGSCDVVPRAAPWRMTREALLALLDPAVFRLWLRGFEVRVLGARPHPASLTDALKAGGACYP